MSRNLVIIIAGLLTIVACAFASPTVASGQSSGLFIEVTNADATHTLALKQSDGLRQAVAPALALLQVAGADAIGTQALQRPVVSTIGRRTSSIPKAGIVAVNADAIGNYSLAPIGEGPNTATETVVTSDKAVQKSKPASGALTPRIQTANADAIGSFGLSAIGTTKAQGNSSVGSAPATSAGQAAPESGSSKQQRATVITDGKLNVRSGPSKSSTIIAQLESDIQVNILSKSEDGQWLKISTDDGATGWVSAQFLEITNP